MGCLIYDFDAHAAGGAGDDFDGAVLVDGVQLVFFDFCDFGKLRTRDLAYLFEVGFAAAFLDLEFASDHVVDGLAEAVPGEGAIFVDLDVNDDVFAVVLFGFFVKWVYELHHVEPPLTEGATDWGASGGAAAWDAEFEIAYDFFCHVIFLYSMNRVRNNAII